MSSLQRTKPATVAIAMGTALMLAACGGGGDSARDEAVDRIVEEGLGRDVAECVVDGTIDAFGEEALDPDFEPPTEDIGLTVDILDDCLFGGE